MSRKEIIQLSPGDRMVNQEIDHIVIEREVTSLSYLTVEQSIKHLQGQILTVIEASITDSEQRTAVKGLIKGFVNDKLTWMFDLYGHTVAQELPNYNE